MQKTKQKNSIRFMYLFKQLKYPSITDGTLINNKLHSTLPSKKLSHGLNVTK